jgi:alanyl-tRNA synthetase
MRSTPELREGFLTYFESKGHKRLSSAPLTPPPEDTSTLLISAGMQPLKPYFLGQREAPGTLLTTYQKCFRATDIDEVGLDGYHLSFFLLIGIFSIGD